LSSDTVEDPHDHPVLGIVSRCDVLATLTRADAAIADDVRHRLEAYAGAGRRMVAVKAGQVTIADAYGEPVAASVVAAGPVITQAGLVGLPSLPVAPCASSASSA
jgi:hypothetical protein